MNIFDIRKRNGKTRRIYAPSVAERAYLAGQVPIYAGIAKAADSAGVQHGFTEGRSAVTNAMVHAGYEYSVSFDLSDFFDSVTPDKVLPILAEIWMGEMRHQSSYAQAFADRLAKVELECFVDGAARQGLPTSPSLANIAAVPIDRDVMKLNNPGRFGGSALFAYSRYADDLTFSCNAFATVQWLLVEIPRIVERHGFKINPEKTKVQAAKAGRRIITGCAVDSKGVYPTREVKRRLRAALHQKDHGFRKRGVSRLLRNRKKWKRRVPLKFRLHRQIAGLKEWAKLKPPTKPYVRNEPERNNLPVLPPTKPVEIERMQTVGRYMRNLG